MLGAQKFLRICVTTAVGWATKNRVFHAERTVGDGSPRLREVGAADFRRDLVRVHTARGRWQLGGPVDRGARKKHKKYTMDGSVKKPLVF